MEERIQVIGGGLAGCEAAWQMARRGVDVRLHEMRPQRSSPAHSSEHLAELVCSNSLRSDQIGNAVGLLHEELRRLDSLVLAAADATRVPAGRALAVDRERFSSLITDKIEAEPRIEIVRSEVTQLPEGLALVATGPLTSDALAQEIGKLAGDSLYFYDSISPTVYEDSLDMKVLFSASRYEDGEGDYLNIPLNRDEYHRLIDEVLQAEKNPLRDFEKAIYFEACLPIEVMAERGRDTLAYGPMKPVGLIDPRTGRRPHAVIQLRREDEKGSLYNLVGFQTKLTISEQQRVFRMLPGMEKAVFARYGSAHRNTYLCAPELLDERLQMRKRDGLHFAGQIAGVEGYVESAALGLLAGVYLAFRARGKESPLAPITSGIGALSRHLRESRSKSFQPMNINFGLFPPLEELGRLSRKDRNAKLVARALEDLQTWSERVRPEAV
ncbi:MAG: methylenetetrahydrofolate--tRNA-(uracil(54)-C(5))-methyltransferase (FADH(2)-oxidizing) TrmFO [bacterium]|nr:methylenetetrahydrofolate--tRNA-(uracil(54)-C(5))-methyltransferase (FADH(2)-oxidizing) TrmFO [bacterium]